MNLGRLETEIAKNIEVIEADAQGDVLEIKETKEPGDFYRKLKIDLGFQLPQYGTWVSGKELKAEIAGGRKLEKVPSGPLKIAGEFQALRGSYAFQEQELKISEGTVTFMPSPQPDPRVRIVCLKQVRDIQLQALVSGPLSSPKLVMSSIPAMNRVDVLSYFMFDHPAGDLSAKERSQLQDRAAAWLGSETSNALKKVLGNTPLAPDKVRYRSATGGKGQAGFSNNPVGTATGKETGIVEVGKYLTPDLFVTYGRGIKGDEQNEVQIEYRLNRHLSVQTQVGGGNQSGVDIFWRHDFGK